MGLPSSAGLPAQALLQALERVSYIARNEIMLLVVLFETNGLILDTRCECGRGLMDDDDADPAINANNSARTRNKRDLSR